MLIVDLNSLQFVFKKIGIKKFFNLLETYLIEDLQYWNEFSKLARISFKFEDGLMELMPIASQKYFSNKMVSTYAKNHLKNKYTVYGQGFWVDASTGEPLMIVEMTLLTAIRTAVLAAIVSKLLARKNSKILGIIGCGTQSNFQVLAHHYAFQIEKVICYDVNPEAMNRLQKQMQSFGINIECCPSSSEVAKQSDILITLTNSTRVYPILHGIDIPKGIHINALGGDMSNFCELALDVLNKADLIAIEYLPQTRIEGEIQQFNDIESKTNIVELSELILNKKPLRKTDDDITLFDGVGFALSDYSVLRMLWDLQKQYNFGEKMKMVPDYSKNNLFQELMDLEGQYSCKQ